MFYTGIGSRNTPEDVQQIMSTLAEKLAQKGYCLRSGHAKGADQAFLNGLTREQPAEIYLPYKTFESPPQDDSRFYNVQTCFPERIEEALAWVKKVHPYYFTLKPYQLQFHIRNVFQVLGKDLNSSSEFVICWAPIQGESIKGGTATAVNIAKELNIPVYNLYKISPETLASTLQL